MAYPPVYSSSSKIHDPHEYLRLVLVAQSEVAHQQMQAQELSIADHASVEQLAALKYDYAALQKRVGVLVTNFPNVRLEQFATQVFADIGIVQRDVAELGGRVELLGKEVALRNLMKSFTAKAMALPDTAEKADLLKGSAEHLCALAERRADSLTPALVNHMMRMQNTLRRHAGELETAPVIDRSRLLEEFERAKRLLIDARTVAQARMIKLEQSFAERANPLRERIEKVEAAIKALKEKANRRYDKLTLPETDLQRRQLILEEEYAFRVDLLEHDRDNIQTEILRLKRQLQEQIRPLIQNRRAAGRKVVELEKEFAKVSRENALNGGAKSLAELQKPYAEREAIFLEQEEEAERQREELEKRENEQTDLLSEQWMKADAQKIMMQEELQAAQQIIRGQFHEIAKACRKLKQRFLKQLATLEAERQAAVDELSKLEHTPVIAEIRQCREKIAQAQQSLDTLERDYQTKSPSLEPRITLNGSSTRASALRRSGVSETAGGGMTVRFVTPSSSSSFSTPSFASSALPPRQEASKIFSAKDTSDAYKLQMLLHQLNGLERSGSKLKSNRAVVDLFKKVELSLPLQMELCVKLVAANKESSDSIRDRRTLSQAVNVMKIKSIITEKWQQLTTP